MQYALISPLRTFGKLFENDTPKSHAGASRTLTAIEVQVLANRHGGTTLQFKRVPGIGCGLIGEGDLSQELGFPRQYDHPHVKDAMSHVVATCKEYNVPVRHPHVTTSNVERVLAEGYRFLMSAPVRTYEAIHQAKAVLGVKE